MRDIEKARALLLKLVEGPSEEEIKQAEAEMRLARLRGKEPPFRFYTPTSEAAARIADEIEGMEGCNPRKSNAEMESALNLARILASSEDRPIHIREIKNGLIRRLTPKKIYGKLINPPRPYTKMRHFAVQRIL